MKRYIKSAEYTDMGTGLEYWYFTTHGVQPGSVPKGIDILEVKDTPNGSYFKTNKVILTDALKKYDIKERSPEIVAAYDPSTGVAWSYFSRFEPFNRQYLPDRGEGHTLATQAATAVTKLVYKWYNDGDVYDNQHGMQGWANDLSTYANWLLAYVAGAGRILSRIYRCHTDEEYEHILKDLADFVYDENKLAQLNEMPAEGSVYEEDGPFVFKDYDDDDDEEYWEDEDDEEEEYEDYEFEEDKEQ